VVTTVRSQEKANQIREAHPQAKLDFKIVEDIAKDGAFDEAVKIEGLEAVIHTASPVRFFCFIFSFFLFSFSFWAFQKSRLWASMQYLLILLPVI